MDRCLFYHASCPDGFGAAWAAWRAWGHDARYVARGHDDRAQPERLEGHLVVFADIAPHADEARRIAEVADQLVVLDHHVTARDRFAGELELENQLARDGHTLHFDLSRSGAVLAWNYLHDGAPVPGLLRYVQDQDLWSWELERSDEVNTAIGSYPMTFEAWDALAARSIDELAREGEPIVRNNRLEVQRQLQTAHRLTIGGHNIEAVNSPRLRSRIGHELAARARFGEPWGAVYRMTGARVDVSVYSVGEFDVSEIAKGFGGGGHRNASGFSVDLEQWLTLLA